MGENLRLVPSVGSVGTEPKHAGASCFQYPIGPSVESVCGNSREGLHGKTRQDLQCYLRFALKASGLEFQVGSR